jgi:RNA recognition motif-containing protein
MNNYQQENNGMGAETGEINDGWSRKNITVKLFVGQVPKIWNEEEVISLFRIFGEILETQIIRDTNGNHRGCAFVKFASLTQADIAIASLNESCFLPGVISPLKIFSRSLAQQNCNSSGRTAKPSA